jgi:hypothetical protein
MTNVKRGLLLYVADLVEYLENAQRAHSLQLVHPP